MLLPILVGERVGGDRRRYPWKMIGIRNDKLIHAFLFTMDGAVGAGLQGD